MKFASKPTAWLRRLSELMQDGGWLASAASGFFVALCITLIRGIARGTTYNSLDFVVQFNWLLFFSTVVISTVSLLALCMLWQNQKPAATALALSALCFAMLLASGASGGNIYFSLGMCVPLFFALRWSFSEKRFPFGKPNTPMWATFLVAGLLFAGFTLLLSYASILRYKTYNATNFDLGLFAQMFEQLRKTGHAWTTLERNRLLTHFGVHCSPVYYLLLPFYLLVPRIETLLVLQAAAVGAGVFAVRAIAKHLFGNSPRLIMAACMIYIFNPAIVQGCLFDFHENKFLAVFLLWAVYFLLRQKTLPLMIFSVLVLSVKEDAAIYVVSLALFLLFAQKWEGKRRKQIYTGVGMILLAVVWFVCAMAVVAHFGDGVMVDRLRNFYLPGEGEHGFADVVKVVLSNLGYVLKQVFTKEKAEFLLWVFLPLGFAPFLAKKNTAWLLLVPLLVINLLSNYTYQYAVGYQYTYGSIPLAIVLALLALQNCKPVLRRSILSFSVAASLLCAIPLTGPRVTFYRQVMQVNPERIAAVDSILEQLPEDAVITATTWFAVHLYQRDTVYMFPNYYDQSEVTPYLICKPEEAVNNEKLQAFIEDNGYELQQEEAFVQVYVQPE